MPETTQTIGAWIDGTGYHIKDADGEHAQTQTRKTALWNNRPVVVLQEDDGRTIHFHGVMIGPEGMSIAKALKRLDACYNRGVKKGGEFWNWDHVLEEMRAAGFEEVLAAEWWE